MEVLKLSKSRVGAFTLCPQKYRYLYVEKIIPEKTPTVCLSYYWTGDECIKIMHGSCVRTAYDILKRNELYIHEQILNSVKDTFSASYKTIYHRHNV